MSTMEANAVRDTLEELPVKERLVALLYYADELNEQEIAQITERSLEDVNQVLNGLRAKIYQRWSRPATEAAVA